MTNFYINRGELLPLISFHQNTTIKVNTSTLQRIEDYMKENGKYLLAFARVSDGDGSLINPSRKVLTSGTLLLRRLQTSTDNGESVTWREIESENNILGPSPSGLPPGIPSGIYIWSEPFQVKLTTSVEISVWCTVSLCGISNNSFGEDFPSEKLLSLICSIKLDLGVSKLGDFEEDDDLFPSFYNTCPENEPFLSLNSFSVVMNEVTFPSSRPASLHQQQLSEYLRYAVKLALESSTLATTSEGGTFETKCQIEIESTLLSTLNSYLGQVTGTLKEMQEGKYSDNVTYSALDRNFEDCLENFKNWNKLPPNNEQNLINLVENLCLKVAQEFERKGFLTGIEMNTLKEETMAEFNFGKVGLPSAACNLLLSALKKYNFLIIQAERETISLALEELETFYKEKFENLLQSESEVFSPHFMRIVHDEIKKNLVEILERELNSKERLSLDILWPMEEREHWLEMDFKEICDENERNLMKLHRNWEKIAESVKQEYVEKIEDFFQEEGNKLNLDKLQNHHNQIKKKLRENFCEPKSTKLNVESYWRTIESHMERYRRVIELELKNSPVAPEIIAGNLNSCNVLVFQFTQEFISMGILKAGEPHILKIGDGENNNSFVSTLVGFDGSNFIFPMTDEEIVNGKCVWSICEILKNPNWSENLRYNSGYIKITLEFLLTIIFRKLKMMAESSKNCEYAETVVAVPYSLSPGKRRQVEKSAVMAGFSKGVYLINDISAVASQVFYDPEMVFKRDQDEDGLVVILQSGANVDIAVFREDRERSCLEMRGHISNYLVQGNKNYFINLFRHFEARFRDDDLVKIESIVAFTILAERIKPIEFPSCAVVISDGLSHISDSTSADLVSMARSFCGGHVEQITLSPLIGAISLSRNPSEVSNKILDIANADFFMVDSLETKFRPFRLSYIYKTFTAERYGRPFTHELRFHEYTNNTDGECNEIGVLHVKIPIQFVENITPLYAVDRNGLLLIKGVTCREPTFGREIRINPSECEWQTQIFNEKYHESVAAFVQCVLK